MRPIDPDSAPVPPIGAPAHPAPALPSVANPRAPEAAPLPAPAWALPGGFQIAFLVVLLALASGGVGALVTLSSRAPVSPFRVAVIDMARISAAVAEAAARDPRVASTFSDRFDQIVRQLHEAEPHRILLVREAVLGNDIEDLTPIVLHLLREDPSTKPLAPGGPTDAAR